MIYVYILKSLSKSDQTYIGLTNNLKRRHRDHNSGQAVYTSLFSPWEIVFYAAFISGKKALAFERYLKRGGGWRFAQRRLI